MSIKDTLRCGDIVTAINGWKGIYMPNYASEEPVFLGIKGIGYLKVNEYDENLEYIGGYDADWTIVEIRRAKYLGVRPWDEADKEDFCLTWERASLFSMLKSGDVIILRNGHTYIYMENWGDNYCNSFLGFDGGWMTPSEYSPYFLTNKCEKEWDIVQIFRPEDFSVAPWTFDNCDLFNLIWESKTV